MEPKIFLTLPDDDNALILRGDAHMYGLPAAATLAKYASMPSAAPCPLPYVLVGRRAAYRAGDCRHFLNERTFMSSSERFTRAPPKLRVAETSMASNEGHDQ